MKPLITIICIALLLTVKTSNAQKIDTTLINNNPKLTLAEAEYLNYHFKDKRGGFDFEGKKVAFITNSSGNYIMPKSKYFKEAEKSNFNLGGSSVLVLTEKEKLASGGYDAFVTLWVKVILSKRSLFKKLKKQVQLSNK